MIERLEQLRREGYGISIESTPGEQWAVSICPIVFNPATENIFSRWIATDEWQGYGETLDEAVQSALDKAAAAKQG